MTPENHDNMLPDLIGKHVIWTDKEKNQEHKALINSDLSYGATSTVYKATAIGADNLAILYGEEYAVKVPLSDQIDGVDKDATQTKYEDEFKLLKLIADREGQLLNVPRAFEGTIEGTGIKPLVLEILNPKKKWLIIEDKFFLEGEILEAALQALEVVEFLAEKRLINTDVKDENFYWFSEEKRFVWLDFNRVIKIPSPDQKTPGEKSRDELGQQIRNSLYKLLAVLYTAYTGRTVPSPLPLITETGSQKGKWGEFPRPLRAALHNADQNSQYSIQDLKDTFEWTRKLLNLRKEKNLDRLIALAEKAKDESLLVNRRIEKIEQVVEMIPLNSNVQQKVDELKKWAEDFQKDKMSEVQTNIDAAIKSLKNQKPTEAKNNLTEVLDRTELPNNKTWKWKAAYWFAVAEMFDHLRGNLLSEQIPAIVAEFEKLITPDTNQVSPFTYSDSSSVTPPTMDKDIQKYMAQLTTALEIQSENIPALRGEQSSMEIIQQYQEIQENIEILEKGGTAADLPALPEKTIVVLRDCLPYVDLEELEKVVEAQKRLQENEENWEKIKDELKATLIQHKYEFPAKLINDALSNIQVDDRELAIFRQAHHLVEMKRWSYAFDKLGLLRSNLKSEMTLLNQYRTALIEHAKKWVNDKLQNMDKSLYLRDIWEINYVIEIVNAEEGNNYWPHENQKRRLDDAKDLDPNDIEKLRKLEDARLEPWMLSSDEQNAPFSVSNLLRLADLSATEIQLKAIKKRFDDLLVSDDVSNITHYYAEFDKTKTALDTLDRDLTKIKGDITELVDRLQKEIEPAIYDGNKTIALVGKYKNALNTLSELPEVVTKLKEDVERTVGEGAGRITSRIEEGKDLELVLFGARSLVLLAAIEYISRDHFEEAIDLLEDYQRQDLDTARRYQESLETIGSEIRQGLEPVTGEEPKKPSWSQAIIKPWIDDLKNIIRAGKKQEYLTVIMALKNDNVNVVLEHLSKLAEDTGQPLFEFLVDRYRLILRGTLDKLWEHYESGQLPQVEKKAKALPAYQRKEWLERIAHTRKVVEFIRIARPDEQVTFWSFLAKPFNKLLGKDRKVLAAFRESLISPEMYKAAFKAYDNEENQSKESGGSQTPGRNRHGGGKQNKKTKNKWWWPFGR